MFFFCGYTNPTPRVAAALQLYAAMAYAFEALGGLFDILAHGGVMVGKYFLERPSSGSTRRAL